MFIHNPATSTDFCKLEIFVPHPQHEKSTPLKLNAAICPNIDFNLPEAVYSSAAKIKCIMTLTMKLNCKY